MMWVAENGFRQLQVFRFVNILPGARVVENDDPDQDSGFF